MYYLDMKFTHHAVFELQSSQAIGITDTLSPFILPPVGIKNLSVQTANKFATVSSYFMKQCKPSQGGWRGGGGG